MAQAITERHFNQFSDSPFDDKGLKSESKLLNFWMHAIRVCLFVAIIESMHGCYISNFNASYYGSQLFVNLLILPGLLQF